jgi:hypothetical protein
MPYHVVADGRVLPLAFTGVQDAYVYALVRAESAEGAVKSWGLIDRGPDGTELVLAAGELLIAARRWREGLRPVPVEERFRQAS